MPRVDIICLANSRKLGGRCVAGLRLDGSGWMRPVGNLPGGVLWPPDYTLTNASEAAPLDVIQIGVQAPQPLIYQPENWATDGTKWTLVSSPLSRNLIHLLQNAIVCGPDLLRGLSDRVAYADFQQAKAVASLALVAPDEISLHHQLSFRGKPQARGRFTLGTRAQSCLYDLVITDVHWEGNIIQQGACKLKQSDHRFFVTVSLGEPFGLYCYKLIAAIVLV